jgi:hypothetical protein
MRTPAVLTQVRAMMGIDVRLACTVAIIVALTMATVAVTDI